MPRNKHGQSVAESDGKVFRIVGGRVAAGPRTSVETEPPASEVIPTVPPTEEQVRELAYQKWESAGWPAGDGVGFWLDAERELNGR
jgi:hypothetical protein